MLNDLTLYEKLTAFVFFLLLIASVAFVVYLKNQRGKE